VRRSVSGSVLRRIVWRRSKDSSRRPCSRTASSTQCHASSPSTMVACQIAVPLSLSRYHPYTAEGSKLWRACSTLAELNVSELDLKRLSVGLAAQHLL